MLTDTRLVAEASMEGIVIWREESANLLQAPDLELLWLSFNDLPEAKG